MTFASSGRRADAKAIAFAAVLLVLAGYAFVFRVHEIRISNQLAENERLAAQVRASEARIRARRALEAERARLNARVHRLELHGDATRVVAHFLRDAARICAAHHTVIAAIAATGGPASGLQASREPFDGIPFELTLDGRYTDVLATVHELSASHVLAAIDIASLARKNADAPDASLTASLRIVLERIHRGARSA